MEQTSCELTRLEMAARYCRMHAHYLEDRVFPQWCFLVFALLRKNQN